MVSELVSDRLDEGQVRKRQLRLRATPPQRAVPQLARPASQLDGETCLADPGLPGHEDESSVASVGGEKRVLEPGQLLLPADEHGRENPLHPTIVARRP
jgi:hypothetical protein